MFEQGSHLSFIKLSFEHKPRVEYCLRIHPSLEYQVWVRDIQLSVTDLREKSFSVPMVNSVSMITKILCSLEDLKSQNGIILPQTPTFWKISDFVTLVDASYLYASEKSLLVPRSRRKLNF